ncbi:MAG: branched-chain amino acid aminotransferase [Candidatus Eisenbacteria bacterium]
MIEIQVQAQPSNPSVASAALEQNLGFGRIFADKMFQMKYHKDRGWYDASIVPFGSISLSPAAMVFHYGQEIFEGHKAYRWDDGRIALFRPEMNAKRLNNSTYRMSMPQIPEQVQLDATMALVGQLKDWVPRQEGASLYLRPTMIATEAMLGVRPSNEYLYYIICSPVGPYYPTGFSPVRVRAEDRFIRAVPGGTGAAKTGGNYAGGLFAQAEAKEQGYMGVLWLDALNRRDVEEIGAMNVMFVIDGKVVTSELKGSILPGITRDSILHLAPDLGIPTEERTTSIDEILDGLQTGRVTEAFGVGTAAVVTPIGHIGYKGVDHKVTGDEVGPISRKIYQALTDIQWGRVPDRYQWMRFVH